MCFPSAPEGRNAKDYCPLTCFKSLLCYWTAFFIISLFSLQTGGLLKVLMFSVTSLWLNKDWDIEFVTFSSCWVCRFESTEADLWWLRSLRFIRLQRRLRDGGKSPTNTGGKGGLDNAHSRCSWLTIRHLFNTFEHGSCSRVSWMQRSACQTRILTY